MKHLLIFGVVNLFTQILSGASGGGGGLISTPFMVVLGLSPAQAIATAKFSGFGTSVGASGRFFKEKMTDKRTVIIFSIIGGIGSLIGSIVLSHFSGHGAVIQRLMGIGMLCIGVPMLFFRKAALTARPRSVLIKSIGAVLLLLGVILQVALGAGVGSLQLIILVGCFGMTALVASSTRRAMQLTVSTIALAVYMTTGLVDYRYGAVGLVTSLIGGFIGAHIAIKKGDKFVIDLFAIVSVLLAFQLLFN